MIAVTAIPGASMLITGGVLHMCAAWVKGGTLTRNRMIGIRTTTMMASGEAWSAGHRAALPHIYRAAWLCYATAAVAVIALLAAPDPNTGGPMIGVLMSVFVVGLCVLCWWMTRVGNAAAREADPQATGSSAQVNSAQREPGGTSG